MHKSSNLAQDVEAILHKQRVQLIRVLVNCGIITLFVFALLNGYHQHYLIAGIQVVVGFGAVWLSFFMGRTSHLHRWTMAFLLAIFSIMTIAQILPSGAPNNYVWFLFMPVLAYSLLGLRTGLLVSAPFMLICLANFLFGPYNNYPAWTITEIANVLFVGVLTAIFMHYFESSRAYAQAQLVALAGTDSLTGLFNRRRFQQTLEHTMADTDRRGTCFALMVLDLDHFKHINDTLGHDAGDEILCQLADCLRHSVRSTDFTARLGGEEFGILLRDVDPDHTDWLALELHRKISDWSFSYQGQPVELHTTAGVAIYPHDATDATTLYKIADRNLYKGKHQGRNRCVVAAAAA